MDVETGNRNGVECLLMVTPELARAEVAGELLLLRPCFGIALLERVLRSIASEGVASFILATPGTAPELAAFSEQLARRANVRIRLLPPGTDDPVCEDSGPLLVSSAATLAAPRVFRRMLAAHARAPAAGIGCADRDIGVFLVPDGRELLASLDRVGRWPAEWTQHDGEEIEICGLPWITVKDESTLARSEVVLRESLRQSYDGWIAAALYRPLSTRLSVRLAQRGVSPTTINVAAFVSYIFASLLLADTSYASHVAAALLIQLSAVLDGCDGEVARLTYRSSQRGGYVDQLLDRYGDAAVVIGISVGHLGSHPSWIGLVAALFSCFTFTASSYVTKEYQLFTGGSPPPRWVSNLRRRDLRNFLLGAVAIGGFAFWGMVAIACLSHAAILVMYWQVYTRLARRESQAP